MSAAEQQPDRLAELRGEMTDVTDQIVHLLDMRCAVGLAIGAEKQRRGIVQVRDSEREAQVLDHAVDISDGTTPPDGLRRIIQAMMDVSSEAQVTATGIPMGELSAGSVPPVAPQA